MPRESTRLPNHHVRRRDRAVEDEAWIKALLRRASLGVLATVYEGQPFLNSNLFVYDETSHVIYMHTASVGRTKANIEADERICLPLAVWLAKALCQEAAPLERYCVKSINPVMVPRIGTRWNWRSCEKTRIGMPWAGRMEMFAEMRALGTTERR